MKLINLDRFLKINTVEMAAWSISLTASLFVAVFELFTLSSLAYIAILVSTTMLIVYFVSKFFIKKFVIYKIKPIYQIITAKNISIDELSQGLSVKGDLVAGIREELTDWAGKKAEEINRLKDNERYRKEFLGNVSHEIKTPVFTIQGYILTLLDGAMDDTRINRLYLERAEQNIDRLINIVNDLDEISKLESGGMVLEMSLLNIVSLARGIADSMYLDASRRSITITVKHTGSTPITVLADKARISQILVNLISNSIKYGREGGHTVISFIDMLDKVAVEVSDDGIGIEKEHQSRIFERFYRVDKSRSREQGGTGLGLAIVKHIIEAHGEKISLRSTPGKGTTFSFTLTKGKT